MRNLAKVERRKYNDGNLLPHVNWKCYVLFLALSRQYLYLAMPTPNEKGRGKATSTQTAENKMGLRRNATGGFVFASAVHSMAGLKELMTQAPMSAEQYATVMKKRHESRRKLEDQLELKRSQTDTYS